MPASVSQGLASRAASGTCKSKLFFLPLTTSPPSKILGEEGWLPPTCSPGVHATSQSSVPTLVSLGSVYAAVGLRLGSTGFTVRARCVRTARMGRRMRCRGLCANRLCVLS